MSVHDIVVRNHLQQPVFDGAPEALTEPGILSEIFDLPIATVRPQESGPTVVYPL